MDEILCANFMVFHDLVAAGGLRCLGRRRGVGARPLPAREPGAEVGAVRLADRLRRLPADAGRRRARGVPDRRHNAETIELVERHPSVRDRAIYVGEPGDIVPQRFGPGLPEIRDWTERHYRFAGYIPAFDPAAIGDRAALRARARRRRRAVVRDLGRRLGRRRRPARPRDRGPARRARAAARPAHAAVAGPRIDPAGLPQRRGRRGARLRPRAVPLASPPATSRSSRAG